MRSFALTVVVVGLTVSPSWGRVVTGAEGIDEKSLIAPDANAPDAPKARKNEVGRIPAQTRLETALAEKTTFDFVEMQLAEVACYLSDLHNIPIKLDVRALEDAGLGGDHPITRTANKVTLSAALDRLLGDFDLTYLIQDEVLLFTTQEAAQARPVIALYRLDALLEAGWDLESIRRIVGMQTKTESEALGTNLAILQSQPAHRRTAALMNRLEAAAAGGEASDSEATMKILKALAEETKFDFAEMPLIGVCEYLSDLHGVRIEIDRRAFEDAGMGPDIPVTDLSVGVSLAAALESMLASIQATFVLQDELLLITTKEAAEARPEIQLYSIQTLLDAGWDRASLLRVLAMRNKTECISLGKLVAIHQSQPAHRRTAELVADLEAAARGDR